MNNNYAQFNERKAMYERAMAADKAELGAMASELLKLQKDDGSFSFIDDYRIDADCRVAYVYYPTYWGAAILMRAELEGLLDEASKGALARALEFSTGRNLAGAGYEATEKLLETLEIFMDAGLWQWMRRKENAESGFGVMIREHIEAFEEGLRTGKTFADWNRNFEKEFRYVVDRYYAEGFDDNEAVWYAAYGSNISVDRFRKYIERCEDKRMPEDSRPYMFAHPVYFAGESVTWGKCGTAFLDDSREGFAYGRLYKITMGQLNEIQAMEGRRYVKRICAGRFEGMPVFTFTSPAVLDYNAPSKAYVETIFEGLKSAGYGVDELVLKTYIYKAAMTDDQLAILEIMRNAEHGITVREMSDFSGLNLTETRKAVRELSKKLEIIRQDRRSAEAGDKWNDADAVYFTLKDSRAAIDNLILWKRMRAI